MRVRFRATVRGAGTALVTAYGLADAEDRMEKEIRKVFPHARVEVLEVRRPEGASAIVESFAVGYRVTVELDAEGQDEIIARRAAFRQARRAVEGTPIARIGWERADLRPVPQTPAG